ncbi:hypothetical protein [Streptomyces sp. H39-C1]|uniref:hypothetical protein n=1 Tax=Streptomyces sp. H39-C1 TaxID=3004355 RepID=UPI0022AFBCD4|nr:hypothetical protein [Streptomyces sp. H39-C1]MCZ4098042.1 hypothetical protein [Streptomyces sp. H39-C1]
MSSAIQTPAKLGGLPEDDGDLGAFAAAAGSAFAPPRRRQRGAAEPASPSPAQAETPQNDQSQPTETTASPAEAEPTTVAAAVTGLAGVTAAPQQHPAGGRPVAVPSGSLGSPGEVATQCSIMISGGVRKRFAAYQLSRKLTTGHEPTNAIVVRRAVIHAKRQDLFAGLLEALRHQQQPAQDEDYDPEGMFGDVPARRTARGRVKDSVQQSFRPSLQELAVIDALTAGHGFPTRSDFLNAALDAFLPQLSEPKGRNSR